MNLAELAAPPDAGLPLQALRDHLRLGSGFDDDALQDGLLRGFLRAAMAAVEARTAKALLARPFLLTVSAWRRPDRQPLPVGPVTAIASVALVDAQGGVTTLAPSLYRLDADWAAPALLPTGSLLPDLPSNGTARVTFAAGFGPAWSDLPPDLAQAVLMLAAHYYDNRHDTGLSSGCEPFGVTALLERHRPIRLSGAWA